MKLLTYSHILAGIISLVVAPIAMAVVKGGKIHRLTGKLFFWSMTWIFISAVILSIYSWKPFLFMVSFVSYYLAFTGYRTLYQKNISSKNAVKWYDWTALIITAFVMLGFGGWGIYLLYGGAEFSSVLLLFGFCAGGLLSVRPELKVFITRSADKNRWLYNHIGRMIGGFIASVTAFSTNVMTFIPGVWPWIWPTLLGTPFIIFWIRSYQKSLANGSRISDLVQLRS